jgi:hypothetical protein
MVELLLPSGAGVVAAGGGAGVAAGGVLSEQADSTSAAAKALRASFVFIDESPEFVWKKQCEFVERKTILSGAETPEARIL